MAILNNNPLVGASGNQGGYNINNSLRFRSSASANLQRTPASATNRRTWTWSAWVKRGTIGSITQGLFMGNYDGNDNSTYFGFSSDQFFFFNRLLTVANGNIYTTQVFRDVSAWYHIVVAMDTTQATAANRFKLYVNGTQVTSFAIETYPTQNTDMYINSNVQHNIGFRRDGSTNNYFDGYLADVNFIDGQALTPSSFGETDTTTGVWKPKAYSGTYGTNGFYLKFSDIATTSGSNAGLGKDFSGNSNYWTTNNISVTSGTTYDAMKDVPTNTSATVANYAVVSPIDVSSVGATISNGNLRFNNGSAGSQSTARATIGVSSGKWYWETTCTTFGGSNPDTGILGTNSSLSSADQYVGNYALGYSYGGNGQKRNNNSGSAYGASYTSGDVIGVALDMDAGTLTFYKNNTSQGTAFTGLSGLFSPAISGYNGVIWDANFGQRPFSYTPPTGYVALNTYNIPDSTIKKGNSYMDATLYTGNGYPTSGTQSITNAASFKPDFIWAKARSAAASHTLSDSVRGTNSQLFTNNTAAQETNTDYVTSFNSNGFSLGTGTSGIYGNINSNGTTYVAWQWQAGQGSTSSNTSGSITSTVSVNTTAGFSVVTYTGNNTLSTIGHGLGVAPKFIIVKTRSGTDGWVCYHASLGVQYYTFLNTTAASYNNLANYWGSTAPSSTTFSINAYGGVNTNGATYVAYCWADVSGYSKAFSYTGNGSSDGPFTFLGLRPKFVLIKRTDAVSSWFIHDTSRDTYNTTVLNLYPNLSAAEETQTTYSFDILSNGFKVRGTSTEINASGGTYIGIAFAENPFKNSNAR